MAVSAYAGGCQCGAVRYEVETDLDGVVACNCSRCQRLGLILAFASPDAFRLVQGADATTDYQFNRKTIHHLFCTTCGVESYARGRRPTGGPEMIAINVRCLDGVEPGNLSPRPVDGRSF